MGDVIHGGAACAGPRPSANPAKILSGPVDPGSRAARRGKSALDTCEKIVRMLETIPFQPGKGASSQGGQAFAGRLPSWTAAI